MLIGFVPLVASQRSSVVGTSQTGVIVPLYQDPSQESDSLLLAKTQYPGVSIVGIINPNSGPGGSANASYADLTQRLRSGGVIVLGYVYTLSGSRNSTAVKADIQDYATWYKVNGVFLDEMASQTGSEGYYKELTSYAKSLGLTLVMGNPGTDIPSSYVGTVDTVIIYEDAGSPNPSSLGGWHSNYDKTNWGIMAFAVSSLGDACVSSISNYTGYVYFTDGDHPNPWNSLPPYFEDLVATLASSPNQACLYVASATLGGTSIAGIWTSVASNQSTVGQGYTPLSLPTVVGGSYTVFMSNYGSLAFYQWDDTGSENMSRTVSTSTDVTLLADYLNYNEPPPPGFARISVNSVNSTGANLTGFYVTFWSNASLLPGCSSPCSNRGLLYSCYSQCSFYVTNGTYYIAVAEYGGEAFDHWTDGNTDRFDMLAVGSTTTDISITAVFSP